MKNHLQPGSLPKRTKTPPFSQIKTPSLQKEEEIGENQDSLIKAVHQYLTKEDPQEKLVELDEIAKIISILGEKIHETQEYYTRNPEGAYVLSKVRMVDAYQSEAENALYLATAHKDESLVQFLLGKGLKPDSQIKKDTENRVGEGGLHTKDLGEFCLEYAINQKSFSIAKLLVDYGADLERLECDGANALTIVAFLGHSSTEIEDKDQCLKLSESIFNKMTESKIESTLEYLLDHDKDKSLAFLETLIASHIQPQSILNFAEKSLEKEGESQKNYQTLVLEIFKNMDESKKNEVLHTVPNSNKNVQEIFATVSPRNIKNRSGSFLGIARGFVSQKWPTQKTEPPKYPETSPIQSPITLRSLTKSLGSSFAIRKSSLVSRGSEEFPELEESPKLDLADSSPTIKTPKKGSIFTKRSTESSSFTFFTIREPKEKMPLLVQSAPKTPSAEVSRSNTTPLSATSLEKAYVRERSSSTH